MDSPEERLPEVDQVFCQFFLSGVQIRNVEAMTTYIWLHSDSLNF